MALSAAGDFDTAADLVIDLVAEDPTCASSHRAWGRVLLDQGRWSDSVAAYRTAAELSQNDPELQFELGFALVTQADKEPYLGLANYLEAADAVHKGLALDPSNTVGNSLQAIIDTRRKEVLVDLS